MGNEPRTGNGPTRGKITYKVMRLLNAYPISYIVW